MSRYNTQVLSNIRMLCRMQNIDEKVLYERAKLILLIDGTGLCFTCSAGTGGKGYAAA